MVQLMMVGMFFLFGYLILKKEAYGLISGFAMKSEEEQQELIKNGYPQASGRGLVHSGFILLGGLVLHFINVSNAILFSWVVMTIYLFAYLFYISKLDLERTRKRNVIILFVTMVFTIGVIGAAISVGGSANELTIKENELQVSGTYGVEWPLEELTSFELVDKLPKVQMRTNGYALNERLKGRFRLEGLGNGRLFLYRDNPPFIYIQKGEEYLFINSKEKALTIQWFEELRLAVEN
nr:DUF3784 domain-containing protein [Anaerobacillus isosaccharinicus]